MPRHDEILIYSAETEMRTDWGEEHQIDGGDTAPTSRNISDSSHTARRQERPTQNNQEITRIMGLHIISMSMIDKMQ